MNPGEDSDAMPQCYSLRSRTPVTLTSTDGIQMFDTFHVRVLMFFLAFP